MERISNYQLFTLTAFFQIGTTVIFGFGASAGKDAWLVSLISAALGLSIILICLTIYHFNPGLTLVEWYIAQFGKWIGTPIAWLYPLYFLYVVGRILNDIKFLVISTFLKNTPFWVTILIFILLVAYCQYAGIEVLGRIGEILLPVFLLLFIVEALLLFGSGEINFKNLQPVLGKGWSPVLMASWPLGASQGFAQTLELAMIWPLTKSAKSIGKLTVISTILSCLFITLGNFLAITILGETSFQGRNFPLYNVIQRISIGESLRHLDAIGVLYFTVSAFFKISLHMFCAVLSIKKLTYMKNERKLIIPLTILSIYLGYSLAANLSEHVKVALDIFPANLWIPLHWVLPTLLLIVTLIRKKLNKNPSCVLKET